jgi:thiamine-monophosphate kinase
MAGHAGGGLRVSIGDDCAVWRPGAGQEIIVTTDQLVEGVHYPAAAAGSDRAAVAAPPLLHAERLRLSETAHLRQGYALSGQAQPGKERDLRKGKAFPHKEAAEPRDQRAAPLGARLVGRGLSDIAAMGGEPRLAFLNVAWPTSLPEPWRVAFLRGFASESRRWKTTWAGGDVSSTSGPAVASITVIGEVPAGKALLRSGARPGDLLYVSGRLGAGKLRITPRLRLGVALRGLATACMDLSDGLSTDLHHLCEESGVGAVVEASRIPVISDLDRALNWGEDYELLFTAHPDTRIPARIAGVAITCIGRCTRRGSGVRIEDAAGRRAPLELRGWQHLG